MSLPILKDSSRRETRLRLGWAEMMTKKWGHMEMDMGVSEVEKHAEGLCPSLNFVVLNLGPLKMG